MSDLYINCPCCGHALTGEKKCTHCHWSPDGPSGRRSLVVYTLFVLFMLLLGGAVLLYVRGFAEGVGSEPGRPGTSQYSVARRLFPA